MSILSLLFTVVLYSAVLGNNINQRAFDPMAAIINGYDSPNRPFYVRLLIDQDWWCGGTIISSRYVLTAAHCLEYTKTNDALVLVGDFTEEGYKNKQTIKAARLKIHEEYDGNDKHTPNDIALIELSEPVSDSLSLQLCDRSYKSYTIGVCGMGSTNAKGNENPKVLQEMKPQERYNCAFTWNGPAKQVCLGDYSAYSCFGDSGGPAYPMDQSSNPICLYGIVSYGDEDCLNDAIYTRVSAYLDWIEKNTQ